jgi:two-component system OmpR family response regulator
MTTAESQPLRVLVVDDEPNIADVISMALRYEGFDVATAANGQDALAGVESYRPHLMVLDIMLPDMEGFEVARPATPPRTRSAASPRAATTT